MDLPMVVKMAASRGIRWVVKMAALMEPLQADLWDFQMVDKMVD